MSVAGSNSLSAGVPFQAAGGLTIWCTASSRPSTAALTKAKVFYEGTARQAAGDYPQNANATVVTSLAGIGIDRTRVQLIVDPAARINEHRIKVRGAFGELEIVLRNNPLATNPKSSELTALSLVRLIEQQGRTVVI